jgi:hypothetical protein
MRGVRSVASGFVARRGVPSLELDGFDGCLVFVDDLTRDRSGASIKLTTV